MLLQQQTAGAAPTLTPTKRNQQYNSVLEPLRSQTDIDQDNRSEAHNNKSPNGDEEEESNQHVRYKQYLIDRVNGKSKYGTSKPPCSACFVPMPVLWFSPWIEQNAIFEGLGRFGLVGPDNLKARRILISLGLICNVLGFCLSIYVAFAISYDHDVLWASAFTRGHLQYSNKTYHRFSYDFRIGIRSVAVVNFTRTFEGDCLDDDKYYCILEKKVLRFDEFCDTANTFSIFDDPEDCDNCSNASDEIMVTLFVSIIMCFPSITTSVLRLHDNYDCNCQKVFGGFAAIISCAFAIYTFVIYQFRCFKSFGYGYACLATDPELENGSPIPPCEEEWEQEVTRLFWAGPGWISLATACGLKILDMIFNLAIPTPTICRDQEEQRQYELQYGKQSQAQGGDRSTADKNGEEVVCDDVKSPSESLMVSEEKQAGDRSTAIKMEKKSFATTSSLQAGR